jgi:hypothetical protein
MSLRGPHNADHTRASHFRNIVVLNSWSSTHGIVRQIVYFILIHSKYFFSFVTCLCPNQDGFGYMLSFDAPGQTQYPTELARHHVNTIAYTVRLAASRWVRSPHAPGIRTAPRLSSRQFSFFHYQRLSSHWRGNRHRGAEVEDQPDRRHRVYYRDREV